MGLRRGVTEQGPWMEEGDHETWEALATGEAEQGQGPRPVNWEEGKQHGQGTEEREHGTWEVEQGTEEGD